MVGWSFAVFCMFGIVALILFENNTRKNVGVGDVALRGLLNKARMTHDSVSQVLHSGGTVTRGMRDSVLEVSGSVAACLLLAGDSDRQLVLDMARDLRQLLSRLS